MSRSQTTLTKMEDFALMSLMKEKLEQSGMSAAEFAQWARTELNNPKINKDHLYYRAKELGLKFADKKEPVDPIKLEARIDDLDAAIDVMDERLKQLEEVVNVLKLAAKHNKS